MGGGWGHEPGIGWFVYESCALGKPFAISKTGIALEGAVSLRAARFFVKTSLKINAYTLTSSV